MDKELPPVRDLSQDELRWLKCSRHWAIRCASASCATWRRTGCASPGILSNFSGLAQSTVSQHLKVLREAGLIEGEVEGPATCYCISDAGVRFLKAQIEGWLPSCCASE